MAVTARIPDPGIRDEVEAAVAGAIASLIDAADLVQLYGVGDDAYLYMVGIIDQLGALRVEGEEE